LTIPGAYVGRTGIRRHEAAQTIPEPGDGSALTTPEWRLLGRNNMFSG
jgi:hypothetical protein